MARPAVRYTEEFRRIEALPRRQLTQADADAWAEVLTPVLRERGATCRLRPWQALSIAEVLEAGGGFLALPVGVGKTLLGPAIALQCGARRPLQIVPAALREKTYADFGSYRGQWKQAKHPIRVVSREELALERFKTFLDEYQPDLIDIDEADDFSNPKSAAVRVIDRYVMARRDAGKKLIVVAKTGTPSRKSIMNYWHLMCWCLGDKAPVPLDESEAQLWADAIDDRSEYYRRPDPGPLGDDVQEARAWYLRRLAETPGVVIVDGDSCSAPLTINLRCAFDDAKIDKAFTSFLEDEENPGGIPVTDPLSRNLLEGQVGCGLYSYWDPPPPAPWVAARRASARFARDVIDRTTRTAHPLDTEGQVFRQYREHPVVEAWLNVRDTFKETTRVKWISDASVRTAVAWLRESSDPAIVWCGFVEFGRAVAQASGCPYYGRLGKCETDPGRPGLHAVSGNHSIVASWQANKKGFNLQAFGRMAIFAPPPSAKWLEQVFGRAHRAGRDAPVVVDIFATSGGTFDAFDSAIREARFAKSTIGLTQKLLRAEVTREKPVVTRSNEYRWATRQKQ